MPAKIRLRLLSWHFVVKSHDAVLVEIKNVWLFIFREKWKKNGKENLGFESSKL